MKTGYCVKEDKFFIALKLEELAQLKTLLYMQRHYKVLETDKINSKELLNLIEEQIRQK